MEDPSKVARYAHPGPNEPKPKASKSKSSYKTRVKDYFFGPRDPTRHSKIPMFFRLHGSILPHLIVPMFMIGIWSTAISYIFLKTWIDDNGKKTNRAANHSLDSLMLTVMGFLVGIGLSFRNSTAYERFNEGRKYWSALTSYTTNLARLIWIHAKERDEFQKEDLLKKITALNLLIGFSKALKHRLRFEPYIDYEDLKPYVGFLDTYARDANVGVSVIKPKDPNKFKAFLEILGLSFAKDNPRAMLKSAKRPLGNLPMEILVYLGGYFDDCFENKTLTVAVYQQQSIIGLQNLKDVLTGCDRILNTPIPIAYSITITQLSWAYLLILPFQVIKKLHWNTIPATLLAAYIILGLGYIGREIENPFGHNVNDLQLDQFCDQIEHDVDVIMSKPAPKAPNFMKKADSMPLYPAFGGDYDDWAAKSKEEILWALREKMEMRAFQ
ncbi:UPF0187 domain membrane protein [Microthyrium microscopicum]|uniref:UPF0187 domain membrane protein n=1 Tax=Microthyrium microscopicum TaxID=703497 RepID=A0A6A6UTD1_9PEZI|nr:UPF0187 domain membrane protein [Microthyrium microscopicum]